MKIRIISKHHDDIYNNIELKEYHDTEEKYWIDIVCEPEFLNALLSDVKVHQLTIEDCTEQDNRGKIEKFENYLFIKMMLLDSTPMHVICFKNLIITYHDGTNHSEHIIDSCIGRLTRKYRNPIPSTGWVCYAILDRIIDNLLPKIEDVNKQIEFCKANKNFNSLIDEINHTRNDIFWYISHLSPKYPITKSLLVNETRKEFIKEPARPYWVDLNENVTRMKEALQFNNQVLESIQNTFVTKISINIAEQNNVLSKVSEKLTILSVIFLPMSFVTGLMGMNVKVPFQYSDSNDNIYGFLIITGITLIISLMSFAYIKKISK